MEIYNEKDEYAKNIEKYEIEFNDFNYRLILDFNTDSTDFNYTAGVDFQPYIINKQGYKKGNKTYASTYINNSLISCFGCIFVLIILKLKLKQNY